MAGRRIRPLALVMCLTLAACSDGQNPSPPAAAPPTTELRGEWRPIADPPRTVAKGHAVWTGDRVVVWGAALPGSIDNVATGGEYDPATDSWTDLPRSPLGACPERAAVWTGTEIIFWGGVPRHCRPEPSTGAAYNPLTRTWRLLPPAPEPHGFRHGEGTWTGKEAVFWGGAFEDRMSHHGATHRPSAAAFDPKKDAWRPLPDLPPPWRGEGGSALTLIHDSRVLIYRARQLGILDEDRGEWLELADLAPSPRGVRGCHSIGGDVTVGNVVGDQVLIWEGDCGRLEGIALTIGETKWKRLGDAPFGYPSDLIVADGVVYAAADSGQAQIEVFRYDVERDEWRELPLDLDIALSPDLIWTGEQLLVMNGYRVGDGPRNGAAFGPRPDGAAR